MTPTAEEKAQVIENLLRLTSSALDRVVKAREEGFNGKYYLVCAHGTKVVVRDETNDYKLSNPGAEVGHQWPSFAEAKRASARWNRALKPGQRAFAVHACSHAQYLDYLEAGLTALQRKLQGSMVH